ncbi:MAG: polyprenyl diphosphate synthase, partial [Bacteroidales bacterium]|nr:polyprenyl diphosphate synthase [Bacteroidales bacterium]
MNDLKEHININTLPKHIGIIMDGNGRWATKQGKERVFGHQHGIQSVREVTEACTELGIPYLTLYAFSTENWNRPQAEVQALFQLLIYNLKAETPTFQKNNIRLNVIGDINAFNQETQQNLAECLQITAQNTRLTLTLALSYSAR